MLPNHLAGIRRPRRSAQSAARHRSRSGVAVVELAVLLPVLVLFFLLAIDFARIFYFSVSLTNCARAGALYACDPVSAAESPYPSVEAAALSDATNLSPQPTVTSTNGTDALGRQYVAVTAAFTFNTITAFPGIPNQVPLSRTVTMYVAANTPNTN